MSDTVIAWLVFSGLWALEFIPREIARNPKRPFDVAVSVLVASVRALEWPFWAAYRIGKEGHEYHEELRRRSEHKGGKS